MKIDKNGFSMYETYDVCIHLDEKHNWCNEFGFKIIGDCIYCPLMLKKNKEDIKR